MIHNIIRNAILFSEVKTIQFNFSKLLHVSYKQVLLRI